MINSLHLPDQAYSVETPALLTVEGIIRLKADYEADVRLYEELPARIKLKKRLFEASLLFAPPGFNPDAPMPIKSVAEKSVASEGLPSVPSAEPIFELASEPMAGDGVVEEEEEEEEEEKKVSWIKAVSRVIEASECGLPHQEVLSKVKEIKVGEPSSVGEKGFYNAISRLEKRGELIKSGGLLYSKNLVEKMRSQGQTLPDMTSEARRRSGGSSAVALEVLRSHPEGMEANQLRDEVAGKPGMPASITKHGHYIYNILAPLIGQGIVIKDSNGLYRAVMEIE